nr:IS3 family transposase [Rheinheimera pacifica]
MGQYTVRLMCRVLEVSASGFYRWRGRKPSQSSVKHEQLEQQVVSYARYKARYGAPRLVKELNALGISCCLNTVASILKARGIRARNGKAFRYSPRTEAMTNVADNLLKRRFDAEKTNECWTTDITYIWLKDKCLYLATVMDLYSRAIVGWSLDPSMTERLITQALRIALARRQP